MKFKIKIVSICILVCMAFVAGIIAATLIFNKINNSQQKKQEITSDFIESKIQEISELSTIQHHYRKIANYQDAKKLISFLPNWRINQSIKELMLTYEGDVKLGFDLQDIQIKVDAVSRNIEITLPEPKILSHNIDFESIAIICENKGWFNEIKFEDFKNFFIEEQKKYEEASHEMMKKRAREQAERIILFYLSAAINIDKKPNDTIAPPQESIFKAKFHKDSGYKINIR